MSGFDDLVAQSASGAPPPTQAAPPHASFDDAVNQTQQETEQAQQQSQQAPSWSEIPGRAASNFLPSAGQFVSNIIQPFLHPIETGKAIGNVGHGLAQRLGVAPEGGHEDEKYWDAVKEEFKNRYGSIDNFKKTLAEDPVGAAGDFSILLGGLGLAERAPGIVGKVSGIAGKVGRAVDPLTGPALAGTAAIKTVNKGLAGLGNIATHGGMKSLEEAGKAGYQGGEANRAFNESAKGITTPDEIIDNARRGVDNMARAKNLDYEQRKAVWTQAQQPLSWNDVGQAIRDAHQIQEFHGEGLLDPRGEKYRNNLDNVIIDWMQKNPNPFHTAAGFDALKKKIGNLNDAYEIGTPERTIGNTYYKAIADTIKKQSPAYADAMESYGTAAKEIGDLRKTLSLPQDEKKATLDTTLRKLTSTQRRNVNTNFGQRARLVEDLERAGSNNLTQQLAGQALSSREPHGLARFIPAILAGGNHWGEAAISALASPYAAGQVANKIGSIPRVTGAKYIPKQKVFSAAQQAGRWTPDNGDRLYVSPNRQARGGKIERAMRAVKKKG